MEAVIHQRHFKPTQGWRVARVSRLTATQFVAAVVRAGQDGDWICFQAGIAGVAFALSNDTRRHARLLFERDREMELAAMRRQLFCSATTSMTFLKWLRTMLRAGPFICATGAIPSKATLGFCAPCFLFCDFKEMK